MRKGIVKAIAVLIIAFSLGLVGFYTFSYMYGDGLERTMQDNGIDEKQQSYSSPLDYGNGYGSTLIMGLLGFAIVLVAMMGFWLVAKRNRTKKVM